MEAIVIDIFNFNLQTCGWCSFPLNTMNLTDLYICVHDSAHQGIKFSVPRGLWGFRNATCITLEFNSKRAQILFAYFSLFRLAWYLLPYYVTFMHKKKLRSRTSYRVSRELVSKIRSWAILRHSWLHRQCASRCFGGHFYFEGSLQVGNHLVFLFSNCS